MRVMVVDTGLGNHPAQVEELREQLGLEDDDELVWLGRQLPKQPLPVSEHLVLGPSLRRMLAARRCETSRGAQPNDEIHRADLPRDAEVVSESDLSEDDLDEQLPEAAAHDGRAANPPAPPRSTGVTYLVKGTRNALRRTWRPLKTRLVQSQHPAVRTGVGAAQALYPGIEDRFGVAAARSRAVVELTATADVVLAHDRRSIPAVWLLGRKVRRPALVVGVGAARRAIEERRPRT